MTEAEWSMHTARRAGHVLRQEQDRIIGKIEVLMVNADQPTQEALVSLARFILDPPNAR